MVSIFTSQTPAIPNINDSVTQNLGTVFVSSVNGNITHIRWFFPTTLPAGTVIGGLWSWTNDGSGTLLGQANFVTPVAGAWNTAQLASPIPIVAGTYYVASVFSQNFYVATGGLFNGAPITNGPLTAPADDAVTPRHNGKFLQSAGGLTYPTGFFNGNGFFVDVVFQEASNDIAPNSVTATASVGAPTVTDTAMTVIPDSITITVNEGAPAVSGAPGPGRFDPVPQLFESLMDCLRSAVNAAANPPVVAPRVGTEVAYDMGQYHDVCCEGLGYVMLGDTWLSDSSFPDQDVIRQIRGACAPGAWAQEFKMGIVRCVPTGQPDGEPPTDVEWAEAAVQNLVDAQSLRIAGCCFRNYVINTLQGTFFDGMSVVINRQIQTNPQGGCIERYVTVTAQFPNTECVCP